MISDAEIEDEKELVIRDIYSESEINNI